MNDDLVHRSESEVSEFEQWRRFRDDLYDIGDGVIVESTSDTREQILDAMFAPMAVKGPKVEVPVAASELVMAGPSAMMRSKLKTTKKSSTARN